MSPNGLTKLFNRVFKSTGRKISTTMFRHVVLSGEFGEDYKKHKESKAEKADHMCHSLSQQAKYIKFD